MGDDVHLGVVEEGVFVQVGGAERQPAVVDDPDLGVHVDVVVDRSRPGIQRACDQAALVGVGFDQFAEHAARVVGAVVRLRR